MVFGYARGVGGGHRIGMRMNGCRQAGAWFSYGLRRDSPASNIHPGKAAMARVWRERALRRDRASDTNTFSIRERRRIPWRRCRRSPASRIVGHSIHKENKMNPTSIALAIFMIVRTLNHLRRPEAEAPAAPPGPTLTEILLADIRDALWAQKR